MSGPATLPTVTAVERLERLEADPNLRHSGARWRLHQVVHPSSGADAETLVANYVQRDQKLIAEFEALLAELRESAPDDEAIGYCEWALGELRAEVVA